MLTNFSPIHREEREKKEREEYERKNPKISQQFADLKRALSTVTDEEWANIPEVGDLTGRNKRIKRTENKRFYAVPDNVLAGAHEQGQHDTSISADSESATAEAADGTRTNFADIGKARDKVLQVRLDQAAQGAGSSTLAGSATSVDPKGYLTSLNKSLEVGQDANLGDITRVRTLLESVIKTNPKHAPGWVAAARLEEVAGRTVAARNLMARGCEQCPNNEDVWMESIRLNEKQNAKIIVASALKHNDSSVRLWLEASKLENDARAKKKVLQKAIDHNPTSIQFWKELVNLEENPSNAKLLLSKATELVPSSVDLWLALARLENAEQAQVVLNKARKAVPTSHEIWVAAGRLQEQMGEDAKVDIVLKRGVGALVKESAMLSREGWIAEAEKCETEGAILTCNAIISQTLGWGLDEDDDRKQIWLEDAKGSINRDHFGAARAIYAYTLRVFPTKKSVWLAAADLERNHGQREDLYNTLNKAVEACPSSQELWLSYTREKWNEGAVEDARNILGKAFKENPDNEDIWLAAVKLESDSGHVEKARELLTVARGEADTDRIWVKSVAFERAQAFLEAQRAKDAMHVDQTNGTTNGTAAESSSKRALDLAMDGIHRYPNCAKLYMQKGQIYEIDQAKYAPNSTDEERAAFVQKAREAYNAGTRQAKHSVPLWLLLSRLEETAKNFTKARSVLERGRLANPKNPVLWTEAIRFERRRNNMKEANHLQAMAMQDCPASTPGIGMIWEERIFHLAPRNQRKTLSLDAIRSCNDPEALIFVVVARVFWAERKVPKAQSWFEKAIVREEKLGDAWAWYTAFLNQYGKEEKVQDVVKKCAAVEPNRGENWCKVAKAPENMALKTEEVLWKVAGDVEDIGK